MTAWQARARCRAIPQLFDADLDTPETPEQRAERHGWARLHCARCPVTRECIDDIDDTAEGIRAGYLIERYAA